MSHSPNLPEKPGFNPEPLIAYITGQQPAHIVETLDNQMAYAVACLQHNSDIDGVEFSHQYAVMRNLRDSIAQGMSVI